MILKVITDKMPESCAECELHEGVYISDEGEGKPTMYAVDCFVNEMSTHDWEAGYASRSPECPFILEGEVFNWIMHRVPVPPEWPR